MVPHPGGCILHSRSLPWLAVCLALVFILGATLSPVGAGAELPDFVACIVCGSRGWSDALANVLLFMPLGAALAWLGVGRARPILYGFALSCAIELAQTFIPGRDPSIGDVTFNTLGAATGQAAFWLAGRALLPDSRTAARLSLLAAVLVFILFGMTARLLQPSLPAGPLRAWYTPALPDMEWYDGRVLRATLGAIAIRPSQPSDQDAARHLLEGVPLGVDAVAGRRPPALAPLFVIADEDGREVFLVGPDRDDLVFRYRPLAVRWRLDDPDLRLRDALASLHPGDTMRIGVQRDGRGFCLTLDDVSHCGLGYSAGSGWALIYYPHHFPIWAIALIEAGWVAALAFPVGLWARPRLETGLALALLGAGLFALPPLAGLIRTPPHQIAGACVGMLLGIGLAARVRLFTAGPG